MPGLLSDVSASQLGGILTSPSTVWIIDYPMESQVPSGSSLSHIIGSCLMHRKLSIQPDMQGGPRTDFWGYFSVQHPQLQLLSLQSLACISAPFTYSSAQKDHYSVFGLYLTMFGDSPWHKSYKNIEFTLHVSLYSRITSLGCLLSIAWKKILHILYTESYLLTVGGQFWKPLEFSELKVHVLIF